MRGGCHFTDDIFIFVFFLCKLLYFDSNFIEICYQWSSEQEASHRTTDKPLSETMMLCLLSDIRVTWPQWVKGDTHEMVCVLFAIFSMANISKFDWISLEYSSLYFNDHKYRYWFGILLVVFSLWSYHNCCCYQCLIVVINISIIINIIIIVLGMK